MLDSDSAPDSHVVHSLIGRVGDNPGHEDGKDNPTGSVVVMYRGLSEVGNF